MNRSFILSQHVIGCSLLMSYPNSKPELAEWVDDQHHGTNKAWLDWFGFVNKTDPVTLSLQEQGACSGNINYF